MTLEKGFRFETELVLTYNIDKDIDRLKSERVNCKVYLFIE